MEGVREEEEDEGKMKMELYWKEKMKKDKYWGEDSDGE